MSLEQVAELAIETMQQAGADFSDIRIERTHVTELVVENGDVTETKSALLIGAGLRAFVSGSWAFAQTTDLARSEIEETGKATVRIAKMLSEKRESAFELSAQVNKGSSTHDCKRPFIDVSFEEKISLLQELNKLARSYGDSIYRSRHAYEEQKIDVLIMNSWGTAVSLDHSLPYLKAFSYSKKGNTLHRGAKMLGGSGGFEVISGSRAFEATQSASELAIDLLSSKPSKGGVQDIIADPDLSGVLAHEAYGHGCEADNWSAGSTILIDKYQRKIGFEDITIIDDPTMAGLRGSFRYDWEGTHAKKRVLIKNGIMNELLHSLSTASELGMELNGAARSQSFMFEPIPRMGNTIIQPGSYSLQEMIGEMQSGLLMCGMGGGYAISDLGQYMFRSTHGYEIKNGELGDLVHGASILGQHLNTLEKIDAVGKDIDLFPGTCGKGEQMV
ncbi:MAG: TldD/PmbA family protein, partial [Candidatus Thorarchaeota archaeon]